jgi:type IX secretion system PorP/SprF family membrane protein
MNRKIFFSLIFWGVTLTQAQQIGTYNHFFYKPLIYNPSLAGVDNVTNVLLLTRYQWVDIKNAPKQYNAIFENNFKNKKLGYAIQLKSEQQGLRTITGVNLTYSYRAYIDRNKYLSFGVAMGVFNHTLNYTQAKVENIADPLLLQTLDRKTAIDGTIGVSFNTKKLQIGLSIPQFLGNRIAFKNVNYKEKQHFIIHGKYKFFVSKDENWSLSPVLLMRLTPNTPLLIETGIVANWKNDIWTSINYKSSQSIATTLGFSINKRYNVGYSYETGLGSLANYTGASHEIILNILFGKGIATPGSNSASTIPLGLNGIIVENLLTETRTILANNSALAADVLAMQEKLSAYSDTKFNDPSLHVVITKALSQLQEKLQTKQTDIILKGEIILSGHKKLLKANYADVFITAIDPKTNMEVGTYLPKPRTGKFIVILDKASAYTIKVEKNGYKTYTKNFTFKETKAATTEKLIVVKLKATKVKKEPNK